MEKIKSLIEGNLYGKSDKLLENFSFNETDSKNLAKEFDSVYESIEKITEGPLSGFFGSVKQGWNAFQNNRLIQKADKQLAKAVAKDQNKLNAAMGVMASALARRINRLGDVGKQLADKIRNKDEATAMQIQTAVDARIKDAQEFLSRVMVAKDNLLADTTSDPKKAAQFGQQAEEKEKKADQAKQQADQAKQQAAASSGINPEPEATVSPDGTPEVEPEVEPTDIDPMADNLKKSDENTKKAAKQEIQNILRTKGRDYTINILNKMGIGKNSGVIGETVQIQEREARGIINPSTIEKLLSSDVTDKSILGAFKKLSRGKQNAVAHQLEKLVMKDLEKTEIGQTIAKGNSDSSQPEEQPTDTQPENGDVPVDQISADQLKQKNLDAVANIITKVSNFNSSQAKPVAIKIIDLLVNDYNSSGSASQTINNFAQSEYGQKFGNDAKQIAIQALDGIVNLNTESQERPIVEEIRKRLRVNL